MQVLGIITIRRNVYQTTRLTAFLLALLSLLLLASTVRAAAYYSTGTPVSSSPTRTCTTLGCGTGVAVSAAGSLTNGIALAATVYIPIAGGPAKVRFQLNGTAPAGYRAGLLLSTTSTVLGAKAVGIVTLRTFMSSTATPLPTTAQDTRVVDADAAQAQIGAGQGLPSQLELISTKNFDQVEIEFAQAINLGTGVNLHYAYGIGQNAAEQVPGYVSRFGASSSGQYNVSGACAAGIVNPQNAVDGDLTNYAQFATLATVNCSGQLRVKLEGTAPGSYQAGFVIGNTNNLLNATILGGLTLRTYDSNGNLLETGSGTSLLGLTVLPDGRSLVSFQATQPFSYVSIERNGLITALDNLQLFYGVGVASTTTTPMVLSDFDDASNHYKVYQNGLLCAGSCGVANPGNAAGPDPNSSATMQTTVGAISSTTLRLDLNNPAVGSAGQAGNRAGLVIGRNTPLDLAALDNVTILTYDDAGNVLETATGSSLLSLSTLADGRQTVSFNTTKDFSKVGIKIGSALSVLNDTSVYYAFADNSNGTLSFAVPTPLPVTLTSLAVRRLTTPDAAEITWTTASEQNSASFVVERSADPANGFQAVGQVAAAGNSLTARKYSFTDATARQTLTLYYRLRQVDTDGSAVLSGLVVLAAGSAPTTFSVYPNPATTAVSSVSVSATAELAPGTSINLYSGLGQLLSQRTVSSSAADAALTVPAAGLPAGIYHVVLRDAAGQALSSQRLVVAGN